MYFSFEKKQLVIQKQDDIENFALEGPQIRVNSCYMCQYLTLSPIEFHIRKEFHKINI